MPLTFPSHPAAVLPLKLWRPRWFDGVALVTGAVSPDVAYLFTGTAWDLPRTHTAAGLLWWCLPVALAYAWVVRRAVAVVAPHLPAGSRFRWTDYTALTAVRHPWWITAGSALLGAISHVVWDRVTHTNWLGALGVDWYGATGVHWWTVSDPASTLLGAVVTVGVARRVADRRDMLTEAPSAVPARRAVFVAVAGVVLAAGVAVVPLLPAAEHIAPTGVRLLHALACALLAGGVAATVTGRARSGRLDRKQR
ncbi:DUF4184 family protein [Micromonospora sp. NPDC047707]|uniref:DUF4184 family protein n=1 Tax=Micromonospora sp. NPDC047707 TaxID=3154498 RepID=UPI003454AE4E